MPGDIHPHVLCVFCGQKRGESTPFVPVPALFLGEEAPNTNVPQHSILSAHLQFQAPKEWIYSREVKKRREVNNEKEALLCKIVAKF